ncbi:DUF5984 family protein [Micromonospora sp. CPCC 205556]|uniref:DUF5984 family protein n=1 Tax=Micromonospora sp. CPCC 205556 TaxID=3122398 RepID=UPI002FF3AD55
MRIQFELRPLASVPTAEFFAAVHDLDRRLIAAMGERVTELARTGPPAEVVGWEQVRSGIAEISSWPLRDSGS